MTTHEPELVDPVDLCTPDGRHLNPAARGWSRRPLHRANLAGRWGRTKRWDYWAVLAGDLVVSFVYANVDYLGLADVWWVDLSTGQTGGRSVALPLGGGLVLPDRPGTAPLRITLAKFTLDIVDDPLTGATRAVATWLESDGSVARLDVTIELPPGHESMNVVIPWSDRTFQYTAKHQARPARGELRVGERRWSIGDACDAWGVLDVGRGRWPYRTNWNWGGGAGRTESGRVVGIQIGGRWTAGTDFTENGVIVDGRLSKIGRELIWDYSWDDPMQPWRVRDPGGQLDLVLTPRHDKHTRTDAVLARTEVHQVFGTWSGTVTPDEGEAIAIDGMVGFAEESRSRW